MRDGSFFCWNTIYHITSVLGKNEELHNTPSFGMDSLTFKFPVVNDPVTLIYLFISECKQQENHGDFAKPVPKNISNDMPS